MSKREVQRLLFLDIFQFYKAPASITDFQLCGGNVQGVYFSDHLLVQLQWEFGRTELTGIEEFQFVNKSNYS